MTPNYTPTPLKAWEYRHFSYSLKEAQDTWQSLADYGDSPEPLARDYFWQLYGAEITDELKRWQDAGWESTEPLSPTGFDLDYSEYSDNKIGLDDIMMWIATLGVALLIILLFGRQPRRYIVYKPTEFSIWLRRPLEAQSELDDVVCLPFADFTVSSVLPPC